MKPYPARFIGEFDDEHAWDAARRGDVALFHGELWIACFCGRTHVIPIDGRDGHSWKLISREPLTVMPSVKVTSNVVCHFHLRDGNFEFAADQTAPLP